ncbi:N-acylethanolamine-hydrolyzing acid amidase-like [Leptodactylus fuscus]|uniref:N-acylethanolamine-hydrolyzing acid amidase-like n=1 Tax=Leptodactylus fuscus TaxID=238119 RepID=UPI003F4ECDA2
MYFIAILLQLPCGKVIPFDGSLQNRGKAELQENEGNIHKRSAQCERQSSELCTIYINSCYRPLCAFTIPSVIRLTSFTMAWMYFLLPLVTCSLSSSYEVKDYVVPRYNISLDLKAENRWDHILQNYNITKLKQYGDFLMSMLQPEWSKPLLLGAAGVYLDFFAKEPFAGEIHGIAKATGCPTSEIVLLNLFYEYLSCTSIIAEDKKGNIYHGRNMDLFASDLFRKITIDVDFIKDGQVVYTGTTFVGFVGLWTGQRPYKFTISANARENNISLKKNFVSLLFGGSPVSWVIRKTLDEAPDYQSAVSQLSSATLITDMYLTVAGVNSGEGASITRDRHGVANIEHLNATYGIWFLLQNNHDTWLRPPQNDRRWYYAAQALNETGQENIDTDTLYKLCCSLFITSNKVARSSPVFPVSSAETKALFSIAMCTWSAACCLSVAVRTHLCCSAVEVISPPLCLEVDRSIPGLEELSSAVRNTIAHSRAPATNQAYLRVFNTFKSWCRDKGLMTIHPSTQCLLEFLQDGLDKGLTPATLKVQVSALSACLNRRLSQDVVTSRFLKGATRLRPSIRSLVPQWDLSTVLAGLCNPPFKPM